MPLRTGRSTEIDPDPAAALNTRLAAFADLARSRWRLLLHVPFVIGLWRRLGSLPLLTAELSRGGEGPAVRAGLLRHSRFARRVFRAATGVLPIPTDPSELRHGKSRKALRKRSNHALRDGVTWRPVHDPEERRRILAIADERERNHPQTTYRSEHPTNEDMLDLRLWLTAHDADDDPILLAVAAVDGDWAMLRYFRVLEDSETASSTRYLMTDVLVGELAARSVRYLATDMSPLRLPPGLREFQQRLGFRLARVRVRTAASRPSDIGRSESAIQGPSSEF